MSLTILHLSDLHWAPWNATDLSIVVDALLADVDRLSREEGLQPDLIVFSGDLAMGGDDTAWFQGGYDALLKPLSIQTGVPMDRIFVAPGNHDIAREEVRARPSIEKGLREELTSAQAINRFMDTVSTKDSEKELSLRRMSNFYDAHDSYHENAITSSEFLRTFVIKVRGCEVGIACLNSAWRATGEADDVDFRKLIVGERAIDAAIKDLQACDFRIAIHHHPLDWLLEADRSSTDFLTRKFFNLSCCGHVHTSRPYIMRDAIGACITSQAGSVYDKREWFNGYQFIKVDLASRNYEFIVREYINQHRRFDAAHTVCDGGRITMEHVHNGDVRRIDQVELFLRANRHVLRAAVAEQLNFAGQSLTDEQAIKQFVSPPLSRRIVASVEEEGASSDDKESETLEEIISKNDNLLFLGGNQVGKTSLAFFSAYRIAFESWETPSIPVHVDVRNYKFNMYAVKKAISNLYGPPPSGFDVENAIKSGYFTIIVDNVVPEQGLLTKLAGHIGDESFRKCRWILMGAPNSDGISPDRMYNESFPEFLKYHVRELNRGRIRTLSRRWYGNEQSSANEAYQLVMNQLVRDGLPRTPYMVSLLLWALQQSKELNKVNEAALLGNIVDHLIGKADFRLAKRGVLNPIGKEITLQNLAKFLKSSDGTCEENEVVSYLISFFDRKKLPFIGGDVLEKLVDCGVLKRDGSAISFKYPCFQDYFYAQLLRNDAALLKEHMSGLNFLHVRREVELLAGIRQQNDDLIETIISTIDTRVPKRFADCSVNRFKELSSTQLKVGTTKAQLGKVRRERLTDEQVDQMMDEADRRALSRGDRPFSESLERANGDVAVAAKQREADAIAVDSGTEGGPIKPATHMAAIDLLARIVRNSDFTDYEVKGVAARHVLQSWVRIFLVVMDEMEAILKGIGGKKNEPLTSEELDLIKYIMSKFIFNAVSQGMIGQMSSPTMAGTITSVLDEEDPEEGERLLGLFMMEDMNVSGWQDRWSEVIKDRETAGFVIDCFVERVVYLSHTKALDAEQDERMKRIIRQLKGRLDWSNDKQASMLENMKGAVALANVREGLTVENA